MRRGVLIACMALCACAARAQSGSGVPMLGTTWNGASGFVAITLEASCTATGSGAAVLPCGAWSATPSAGDAFVIGCYTNNGSFDPSNLIAYDRVNGFYDAVVGQVHPASADDRIAVFVKENVANGTTVPQCQNWEANGMGITGYAFKGVPTSFVLDGKSAINLFKNFTTTTTPNAGTAGSPTNSNEVIFCQLVTNSSQTTTAGSGYTPSGTLTGVINTLAQYTQYQVNPGGTVNCNYTLGTTKAGTDTQIALLNASSSGGYHALTGMYGVPAAAQTNAATATVAILNNNTTGSLTPLEGDPAATWWSLLAGSAVTFDTGVAPLGTIKLLVEGTKHTLGDAATSIKFPSANVTTTYQFAPLGFRNPGTGVWVGSWLRMGSNATNNNVCDTYNLDATMVEGNFTTQVYYDTTNSINFHFELDQGNTVNIGGMVPSPHLNLAQDYYIITHVAGINEANDELFVFYEATPGTLPWVLHDHFISPKGGRAIASTTATAGSGASSITVASATGIVKGQSVYSAAAGVNTGQITIGTTVTSIAGTTIGLSINTAGALSSTPVIFAGPVAATTGSTTAGSTTLTVASGTGLVSGDASAGQYIGMAGVATGTWLLSGSGTTWTMSQPAVSTQTTVTAQFWSPFANENLLHFGKYSSCNSTADFWFSGMIYDPYGTILPLIASGALSL